MPNYKYQCTSCNYSFFHFRKIAERKLPFICSKCKQELARFIMTAPNISIPKKHQSAPKDYDTHPLDGGVPFGEVPGDEDYEWMKDKNKKHGPTP